MHAALGYEVILFQTHAVAERFVIKAGLDGQKIAALVGNMHAYSVLKEMRKATKGKAQDAPVAKVRADIIRAALESTEDSFVWCLRMLIDHIVNIEANVEAKEAKVAPVRRMSSQNKPPEPSPDKS